MMDSSVEHWEIQSHLGQLLGLVLQSRGMDEMITKAPSVPEFPHPVIKSWGERSLSHFLHVGMDRGLTGKGGHIF